MYRSDLGHGPAVMSTQVTAMGSRLLPAPPGAVAPRERPRHGCSPGGDPGHEFTAGGH